MEYQIRQVVNELFPVYDKDQSGNLDARELKDFLT
jgi:Ca2+-binding EF-hand superfamily protein